MLYNVEYISEYIPDKACEVFRVGWSSVLNVCPEALFRGSAVCVYSVDLQDTLKMAPQGQAI
jgi:hypothetical protein